MREALRLEPDDTVDYGKAINAYLALNRFDKPDAIYQQANARKLDFALYLLRYEIAFPARQYIHNA